MNFHEARNFLIIIQERNLSKAATKTHMTQPALSKLVMKLEKVYNTELFDRSAQPWKLTYEGELLVKHAKTVLENEEALRKELEKARRKNKGRIILGAMPFEEKYLLPNLLSDFYIGKYDYDIEIITEEPKDIEKAILEDRITFATIVNPIRSFGLKSIFLKEYEMIAAVPRMLLKSKKISYPAKVDINNLPDIDIGIFKNDSFVFTKPAFYMCEMSLYICDQAGFVPKISAQVVNTETALGLVSKNAGIAFVFDEVLKHILPKENVVYFRLKDIYPKQRIDLAFKENLEFTNIETSFLSVIKKSVKNI